MPRLFPCATTLAPLRPRAPWTRPLVPLTRALTLVVAGLAAAMAAAQTAPAAAAAAPPSTPSATPAHRADPLDARVPVPPVRHASSLSRSPQRPSSEGVGSWRDANETVNRVGGWRAYAREAAEASGAGERPAGSTPTDPARSGAPSASPSPTAPHHGHGTR